MENQKSFLRLFIAIIIIIILGAAALIYYLYPNVYNDALNSYEDYKKSQSNARIQEKLESYFPQTIGEYTLDTTLGRGRDVEAGCEKVGDHPDTKSFNITGEVCMETYYGAYKTKNNKVVFVSLLTITKGSDIFEGLMKKMSTPLTLNGYSMIRVESHEIAWYPKSGPITAVLTQEGTWVTNEGGWGMMRYGKATGANEVTKAFIEKYPPAVSQ